MLHVLISGHRAPFEEGPCSKFGSPLPRSSNRIVGHTHVERAVDGDKRSELCFKTTLEIWEERASAGEQHIGVERVVDIRNGRLHRLHDRLRDARLLHPDVRRVEQELRHCEALHAEGEHLLVVCGPRITLALGWLPVLAAVGINSRVPGKALEYVDVVGHHVLAEQRPLRPALPGGQAQVGINVLGDVAQRLLHLVDHVRLLHDVPLSVRDDLLEVVGEQLAAHIDAAHAKVDLLVVKDGHDVCVAEASVDDQGRARSLLIAALESSLVAVVGARRRRHHAARLEVEVLEDHLVEGGGDRVRHERRDSEHQLRIRRVDIEDLRGERLGPDVGERFPVCRVALLHGELELQAGEVVARVELRPDERFALCFGLGDQVWNNP
mmetsp:Transcript_13557/g.45936  ORF Transcript_13557/g.45936 Transcript_13557/m.45936 type:complete len:381 (-) Transcript_13557:136-1278(-)